MKNPISRLITVIFITTSTLVNAQDWATPGTTWDMTTGIPIETTPKQAKSRVMLVKNAVDEFTGKIEKATSWELIGGSWAEVTGARVSLIRVGSLYTINIKPSMIDNNSREKLGCAGSHLNYITFLFQDGTTLTLNRDLSKTDCSANSTCIYDISGYEFKPVKKIRVQLSNGSRDIDWTCQYSMQELFDALK